MPNNLFYKTLSILGTLGIIVLSSTQVWIAFKEKSDSESQISKTLMELRKEKKEAIAEVKKAKKEILEEINTFRSNTILELKNDKSFAIQEISAIKSEALSSIKQAGGTDEDGVSMIIRYTGGGGTTMATVPMQTFSQCEIAGATMEASKRFTSTDRNIGFECVETGK